MYLNKPGQAKIFADVIIREVSKSSHPHIGSNEDSYGIVDFCRSEVMIHDKQDLDISENIDEIVIVSSTMSML